MNKCKRAAGWLLAGLLAASVCLSGCQSSETATQSDVSGTSTGPVYAVESGQETGLAPTAGNGETGGTQPDGQGGTQAQSGDPNTPAGQAKPGSGQPSSADPQKPSYPAFFDDLKDTKNMFSNKGLQFDTSNASLFDGDDDRAIRAKNTGLNAEIVYKQDAVTEVVLVYAFGNSSEADVTDGFVVSVSKDNKSWTQVEAQDITYKAINGNSWMKEVAYYGGIDEANQYVKITFPKTGSEERHYNPNLFSVQINGVTEETMTEAGGYCSTLRAPRTIYVDSKNGKDTNSGLSESAPIKSLYKANSFVYAPGDKLLLKRGGTYAGQINLIGSGAEGKPVVIGAYGSGDKPVINTRGGSSILANGEYIQISDLDITNSSGVTGIRITAAKPGANKGISITNCSFRNINVEFKNTSYESGGIVLMADGRQANWFDGVKIENNTFDKVGRCGVYVGSNWASRVIDQGWGDKNKYVSDTNGWYPNLNVQVRNNQLTATGGDGILLIGAKGGLIERNVVMNSALFKNPGTKIHFASIWMHSSNDCIVQYNEVMGNRSDNNADDLQAFDSDISCKNNIFQYNYSHDNAGGFMLLCADSKNNRGDNTGTIVRYNLSVNDGEKGRAVFTLTGEVTGAQLYNNTVYMGKNTGVSLITTAAWSGYGPSSDNRFMNNIFAAKSKELGGGYNIIDLGSLELENNMFYNIEAPAHNKITVKNAIFKDPQFVGAGSTGNGRDAIGQKYRPKAGSPALSGGIEVKDNGGKDYFGNATDGKFFGAFCK